MVTIKNSELRDLWKQAADGIGEPDDSPVSDGSSEATIIALLKGLQGIIGLVTASPTSNTVQDRLKALADRIGEVAASPTANTLLARLKTLEGYLDGLEAGIGAPSDAAATGDGSLIAIVKQLRAILTDVWNDTNHRLNAALPDVSAEFGSTAGSKGLMIAGSDGSNARAIKTKSDGTVLTELTGRIVEEVVVYNALAIASTGNNLSGIIDVSKYRALSILVRSSLDQSASVRVTSLSSGVPSIRITKSWDTSTAGFVDTAVVIPVDTERWYALHTHPQFAAFLSQPIRQLQFNVVCTVAPTSGSFMLVIWGVPN